ncbi:protein ADM2a [Chanos chanos]|uniref:Protein ADM2a n=1 Tax=Chanos chanos TaxID=29144 RepID=A0A6J2V8F1_CHACN|nr:protein ADM2 [Chanos chanos]
MGSLLPVTVYCISLFSLPQLLALPVGSRLERTRSELMKRFHQLESNVADTKIASSMAPLDSTALWRALLIKHPPSSNLGATHDSATLTQVAGASALELGETRHKRSRGRRHVHAGSRAHHHQHHAQLMRVGCVLGTCQVQNLSHRLYQLIGQSGREDSSPINPRSPHSYG